MRELNFETGLVTYKVNGTCELQFNPADMAFVERVFQTFNGLAKQQDDGEKDFEVYHQDGTKLFELAERRDREMREQIDKIFGKSVCAELFPNMSVYALAGGLPLWCNFLMAIIDEIDASITEEQKKASPRMEKYVAKYAKYQRK